VGKEEVIGSTGRPREAAEPLGRLVPLIRWLALAALADWAITRTLTRSAIFMPKSPPVIAAYQVLAFVGQLASTLTALLALVIVGWIALGEWRVRRAFGLSPLFAALAVFSLLFLVVPPGGWLAVGHHLLVVMAVAATGWKAWTEAGGVRRRIGWVLPALAVLAGELYQLSHALFAAMRWPGPPPFATSIYNAGELLVVLSPAALWWAVGQGSALPSKLWAALPALAFATAHLINPAMTGIIAIWSTGLTLYLPWPLYALSLWLATATVITSMRRGEAAGWAILMLAAGGYAPQFSTHVFLSLTALWLLASPPERAAQVADVGLAPRPPLPTHNRLSLSD
jgi:hypothetical protein